MVTKALAEEVKKATTEQFTTDQVQSLCETFLTVILDKVKAGEDVTLTNFLKFERALNKERTFSIPNSDKTTTKPERYSLKVKVMSGVKTAFETLPVETDSDVSKKAKSDTDSDEVKPKAKKAPAVKKAPKAKVEIEEAPKPKGKKAVKNDENSDAEKPKGKKVVKKVSDDERSDVEKPKGKKAPVKKNEEPLKKEEAEEEFMFESDDE